MRSKIFFTAIMLACGTSFAHADDVMMKDISQKIQEEKAKLALYQVQAQQEQFLTQIEEQKQKRLSAGLEAVSRAAEAEEASVSHETSQVVSPAFNQPAAPRSSLEASPEEWPFFVLSVYGDPSKMTAIVVHKGAEYQVQKGDVIAVTANVIAINKDGVTFSVNGKTYKGQMATRSAAMSFRPMFTSKAYDIPGSTSAKEITE